MDFAMEGNDRGHTLYCCWVHVMSIDYIYYSLIYWSMKAVQQFKPKPNVYDTLLSWKTFAATHTHFLFCKTWQTRSKASKVAFGDHQNAQGQSISYLNNHYWHKLYNLTVILHQMCHVYCYEVSACNMPILHWSFFSIN